jgi:hypothetical protein
LRPSPEKYDFVSWDNDIPYGKIKAMFQTTNQYICCSIPSIIAIIVD